MAIAVGAAVVSVAASTISATSDVTSVTLNHTSMDCDITWRYEDLQYREIEKCRMIIQDKRRAVTEKAEQLKVCGAVQFTS